MKKTLAAVAVLGAFAGSALAADVQLYGIVDTGVGYNHVDTDTLDGFSMGDVSIKDSDSFSMKSGQQSGSRFGFKGTEDLGNGLTVGFILENQFDSDTGALKNSLLFHRESSLFLQGNFGKLAFGRMGSINNGTSSWGKIGMVSAFGTSSWGGISAQVSNLMSTAGVWNNMISYETPDFAGFKVFAQYAMGSNDNENESSSDRYYAIGATYNNGPFAGYFAVDSVNYKTYGLDNGLHGDDVDDSLTVTLGGSYNFEVVKVYLGAQYFDEVTLSSIGGVSNDILGSYDLKDFNSALGAITVGNFIKVKGYGISLSADAPVAGGKAMFGIGYVDAEAADSMKDAAVSAMNMTGADMDLKRYIVSVGYDYPFSKRTDVYAVASYSQDKIDWKGVGFSGDWDPSTYSLYVGLRHKF